MTGAGDICLADLNEERRRHVLVVSDERFHRHSGRVLVAPELPGPPDEVPYPWRVEVDGTVFAVDLLRSLPVERLLDRTDRAPASAMQAVHTVLRHIA